MTETATPDPGPGARLLALLRQAFPHAIAGAAEPIAGQAAAVVRREDLVAVMTWLRDDPRTMMAMLVDVTASDFAEFPPERRAAVTPLDVDNPAGWTHATLPRFEVVYHLLSLQWRHRLRVKVPLATDDLHVPTLCGLWIAANWGEREAWDMYGVVFDGHPELRRILLYDEFEGHPLRKDYPLRGYQPLVPMPELAHYTDHETWR
ncbi:MAG: NADH-quinone oxidoreductase subunit C [Myxococcales bacterium]|nr:NADH-quinone oxidoreductase subunit C [Myxococcales bacterium]